MQSVIDEYAKRVVSHGDRGRHKPREMPTSARERFGIDGVVAGSAVVRCQFEFEGRESRDHWVLVVSLAEGVGGANPGSAGGGGDTAEDADKNAGDDSERPEA